MGSYENEMEKKDLVITQVSFGGFDKNVSSKDLTNFLEKKIGLIWRCRLKNSWTPPGSYPNFDIVDTANIQVIDDFEKVVPHAFVHFASAEAATTASNDALILNGKTLMVNRGLENSFRINQKGRTTNPLKFNNVRVEIGTLASRDDFLVGWKSPTSGVNFVVDPFDDTCKIFFTKETAFSFEGTENHTVVKCDFKLEFSVREITEIKQDWGISSLIIWLQLASSPHLFYRTADDDIYDSVPFDLLDDEDPWIRTTDFTPGGAIGRCNSYRISMSPRFGPKLKKILNYLKEWRIPNDYPIQHLSVRGEPDFGMPMSNPFFCIQHMEGISFDVMYMVNAVMHRGIINQHQLSDKFFELLRGQRREVNITALSRIYSYRRPVFDAYESLQQVQEWILKNPKFLESSRSLDCNAEVRKLVITPTKAYCLPPEVELSNRVLRKYKEVSDRFLRVTFMDEGLHELNSQVLTHYVARIVKDTTSKYFPPTKTCMFKRVKTIMEDGFYLCGRKYSFLTFTPNQLKDRSAWFFAEDNDIKVNDIKRWMGKFDNRNVAKCTARMGQCFSSTFHTIDVPLEEVNFGLPDIKRKGYIFSDGIGMLTPDLAREVADKLHLSMNPPSAYQIRFGGCKGVIACWPGKDDGKHLSLRPSMNKFISNHTILEIASWTRFQPGFLNRQIITLLSALSVPDDVFSRMQDSMVCRLNEMLENTDVAFDILTSSCAEQGKTAAMMLSAGFKPQSEPHLKGMLCSIRAAQLGGLLVKTRIFVPSGRLMMGCLDELGVLEHGQCFIQVSSHSLENCFSKHGKRFSEAKRNEKVIKGLVVIAKNPCLHPGDIRILEAVEAPELHHLVDCLVFPQKGDRPHTDEASGSDLDGDCYFVSWDENLIPPSKMSQPPMDYNSVEANKLRHPLNNQDIIDFFTKNLANDPVGPICNAHVALADQSKEGALDEDCIELAKLAAIAVDFPKTGKYEKMPQHLKPKLYPDFMGKEAFQTYKSNKILGKLYRKIKDASDGDILSSSEISCAPEDVPYDTDLEMPGSEDFVDNAWNLKCSYEGQLKALLGQYLVSTEEEIVTGHVWSLPTYNNRKHGDIKEKIKDAYHVLKKEFKNIFKNIGQDSQQLTEDEMNALYEQKASAWYQVSYHPQWVKKSLELRAPGEDKAPAMLSFAWIPVDYLVRIKVRSQRLKNIDTCKPINSLASYLAQRI